MQASLNERKAHVRFDLSRKNNTPLTGNQKAAIGILAKKAFVKAQQAFATDDLSEKEWRHREAINQVGCTISEAKNGHFKALKGHFAALAGETDKAFAAFVSDNPESERKENALAIIREELASQALPMAYADTIAHDEYQHGTLNCTGAQLESLVITVKNRMAARRRKNAAKAAAASDAIGEGGPF